MFNFKVKFENTATNIILNIVITGNIQNDENPILLHKLQQTNMYKFNSKYKQQQTQTISWATGQVDCDVIL